MLKTYIVKDSKQRLSVKDNKQLWLIVNEKAVKLHECKGPNKWALFPENWNNKVYDKAHVVPNNCPDCNGSTNDLGRCDDVNCVMNF